MSTTEATEVHQPEHAHPDPRRYVIVAIVLAVITMAEVILFYIKDLPHAALIAALLVLSSAKFAIVVGWFMHLRFDNRLFRRLFVTGLSLAMTIYTIVLLTFVLRR